MRVNIGGVQVGGSDDGAEGGPKIDPITGKPVRPDPLKSLFDTYRQRQQNRQETAQRGLRGTRHEGDGSGGERGEPIGGTSVGSL